VRVIEHGELTVAREQFFIDAFNVFLVTLTSFVGFTTSLFSRPYMRIEADRGRLSPGQLRLYHSMYQLFIGTMLLALTTNNLGLMWVAMEAATLSTVLLVTLYRTPASLEAGWKYFILCGVGIAQALFGTMLVYFAAERVLGGEGVTALLWTHLDAVKSQLEPRVLGLAFVFLLVGYGTKVGLAPLHNWLPDAHAEGPTPISAVLSGLLLNVAIYAVVRCKVLVEGSLQSQLPGRMLMGFGLVSVVLAAFFLWRQRDIKRLFAYSSIEHMGIITFAFGMGGPVANFAALLHMTVHSLTKSAIFFAVGHAAQKAGSQLIENIRGLVTLSPTIGWGLMLGSLAILGMPPFGVFTSEFLILTTAMREQPWATPILLVALGVAFAAIFGKVQPMVFGETNLQRLPHSPALLPVFAHLALVLMLGLYVPPYLASWYRDAARLIGGH
jgi:hydrogenase-4 component F